MTISTLQIGETINSVTLPPVSRIDLIKYAGASLDFNPIHTIDDEARNTGLPGVIAHGMWTMGNLGKLFTDYYDIGFVEHYSIRFSHMVFLNDELTLQAKLLDKEDNKLRFYVATINQHEKEVIRGEVVFSLFE